MDLEEVKRNPAPSSSNTTDAGYSDLVPFIRRLEDFRREFPNCRLTDQELLSRVLEGRVWTDEDEYKGFAQRVNPKEAGLPEMTDYAETNRLFGSLQLIREALEAILYRAHIATPKAEEFVYPRLTKNFSAILNEIPSGSGIDIYLDMQLKRLMDLVGGGSSGTTERMPEADEGSLLVGLRDNPEELHINGLEDKLLLLQSWEELRPRILEAVGMNKFPKNVVLVRGTGSKTTQLMADLQEIVRGLEAETDGEVLQCANDDFDRFITDKDAHMTEWNNDDAEGRKKSKKYIGFDPEILYGGDTLFILLMPAISADFLAARIRSEEMKNPDSKRKFVTITPTPRYMWPDRFDVSFANPIEWVPTPQGTQEVDNSVLLAALISPFVGRVPPPLIRAMRYAFTVLTSQSELDVSDFFDGISYDNIRPKKNALSALWRLWSNVPLEIRRSVVEMQRKLGIGDDPLITAVQSLILNRLDPNQLSIEEIDEAQIILISKLEEAVGDGSPIRKEDDARYHLYYALKNAFNSLLPETLSIYPEIYKKQEQFRQLQIMM